MARNDVVNVDGSINYNTIGGFKDRLDGHDSSLAQNTKVPSSFNFSAGSQDNTTNIQNALSNSNRFHFPAGNYLINLTQVVVQNTNSIVIDGEGQSSVIQIMSNQIANGTCLYFKNMNGIIIRNIKLSEINAVLGRYNVYGTLTFDNCQNIWLENVIVDGANGAGILGMNCQNVWVVNCKVNNTYADGIHFQRGSKNVHYINNQVTNAQDDCLAFISNNYAVNGYSDGFEAYGNILNGTTVSGSGICCDGAKNVKVHDNKITNTQLCGIRVNPMTDNGNAYPSNVEIYDNTIDTVGLGSSGNRSGINVSIINNVKIIDNKISNAVGGVFATGCEGDISIRDNKLNNVTDRGIWVSTQATQNTYSKVEVEGNTGYLITNDGIFIDGTSQKPLSVINKNNKMFNVNQGNTASKYGFYCNASAILVYEDNIITSAYTITNNAVGDTIYRKGNIPLDANDNNYIGGATHTFAGTAPTTGVHALGDICWNWNPQPGTAIGWVCVTAGTPGTWKQIAQVMAT